jgi:hypothetical protein
MSGFNEVLRIRSRSSAFVTTTFQAFKDRIVGDLLPTFCDDPSRGWGCGGFKEDWKNVTEKDAADFLLALDAGLIEHQGRGLYRAPRSHASEQFFWSGKKSVLPRPVAALSAFACPGIRHSPSLLTAF